jgi:hypothetical protein
LIASSGIRAKVDCFLQQSPIHTITMFFWNEEEQVRLDKMRLEFLAYKEASKRMEEIRKRIESFSPPHTSPASQAPPIQPTPPATRSDRMMPKPQAELETQTTTPTSPVATVTKKRKKRVMKQPKSIHTSASPNHRRPASDQPTPAAHPEITGPTFQTRRHQLTSHLHAYGSHSCSLRCERDKEESFCLALVREKKIY